MENEFQHEAIPEKVETKMKRLKKYLLLAFLITWALWWGDALLVRLTDLQESDVLPQVLFTVGGLGPAIAALLCFDGKLTLRRLGMFLFGCKKSSAAVLLLLLALEAAAIGLSLRERNPAISTSAIPLIFLQAVTVYGGSEELGWRGVLQPLLQKKLPWAAATLLVGAVWALWHLPLWFIEGNSHQGSPFLGFALLAILLSFWLAAVVNSRGSVFWCMLLHGASNTLLSVFVIKVNFILLLGLLLLTALSVYLSARGVQAQRAVKTS